MTAQPLPDLGRDRGEDAVASQATPAASVGPEGPLTDSTTALPPGPDHSAARSDIALLLAEHEITLVVAVDDHYAEAPPAQIDDVIAAYAVGDLNDEDLKPVGEALKEAGQPLLAAALEANDRDGVEAALTTDWSDADPGTVEDLVRLLASRTAPDGARSGAQSRDAESLNALRGLLPKRVEVRTLPFREWLASRDEILSCRSGLLVLLDRDGGGEGLPNDVGEQELRYVAQATGGRGLVALLTHTVQTAEAEEQLRQSLQSEHEELAGGGFLVMAKTRLSEDAARTFPLALRVALLAPTLAGLRSRVAASLQMAQSSALVELQALSPHDLAAVLTTGPAKNDGVWEPDILLRLVAARERAYVRSGLRGDDGLHDLATRLRRISKIGKTLPGPNPNIVWELQSLEYFEQGEHINALLLPPEVGDIYEMELQDAPANAPRWVILLGQACDLTVRDNGRRANGVLQVTVATVEELQEPAGDIGSGDDGHFRLPHFPSVGSASRVRLALEHALPATAVDYASLNQDGMSILQADGPAAEAARLTPYWQKRDTFLRKELIGLLRQWREWAGEGTPSSAQPVLLRGLVGLASPTVVRPAITETALTYGVRRVARLREPYALALSQRVNNRRARLALEAPLGPGQELLLKES